MPWGVLAIDREVLEIEFAMGSPNPISKGWRAEAGMPGKRIFGSRWIEPGSWVDGMGSKTPTLRGCLAGSVRRAVTRMVYLLWALSLITLTAQTVPLIPPASVWRWLPGTNEASRPDPAAWRLPEFNDSAWPEAPMPFWYGDRQPDPGTELTTMRYNYTCIFLRRSFVVANPSAVVGLRLYALSDDGFIAWLNGVEVARFNMPDGFVPYNGTSLPALPEPLIGESYELGPPNVLLRPGTNVLAVQAFNSSLGNSSDFVIHVDLEAEFDDSPPLLTLIWPPPDSRLQELRRIEVGFSEPVTGVDAADLRVNGVPATNLVLVGPDQYVFEFPPPPPGPVAVEWSTGHGITDPVGWPLDARGWSYTIDPSAAVRSVWINEFLASNSGRLPDAVRDELGNSPDWIELFNAGDSWLDLGGWSLTDNAAQPAKWRFPAGTLVGPRSYMLVLASGRDTNVQGRLHTNFRLSASPGYLGLFTPNGEPVSVFSPSYPQQYTDVSYGRDRLEPQLLGYFTQPTPGAPNATRGAGFGPEVRASRVSGTFLDPFTLSLTVPDPNAWEIRYLLITTNVPASSPAPTNVPTTTSPLYTGPISITNTVIVRARAFPKQPGFFPGPPASFLYVRLGAAAAAFTSPLPILLIHNLGGGAFPSTQPRLDRESILMVFHPIGGIASLTNPPALVTRAGVNVRGSSTAGLPQKSYAVETWDEFNDDRDVELLEMPAESDWVLYGQNLFDPSFLHNPLAHAWSRAIGRYSPRTRFAEVFVNTTGGQVQFNAPAGGDYHGLYTVLEKIKRNDQRVNIARLEAGVTNLPALTGGYLLKVDRADADERTFYDPYLETSIVYVDPPGPDMMTPARSAQAQYIQNYLLNFGAALTSAEWTNPVTGYHAWIDVPSWIDHHLLNVLALNVDALRLSAYFFKERERKLEMGPLWDFDRAMGTSGGGDLRAFNPRSWMGSVGLGGGSDYGTDFFNAANVFPNGWYRRLFRDPDFWQAWIDRWQELRPGPLHTNALFALVDEMTNQIAAVHTRQTQRWSGSAPRSGTVSSAGYSHWFPGTYAGEIAFLKRWLADRVHFIDTNFLAPPQLDWPAGAVATGTVVRLYSGPVPPGTVTYYTLDGSDPRAPGGAIASGARSGAGEISLTITSNVRVVARNYNPQHRNLTGLRNPPISSPWSGPVTATYVVETPPLLLTELMYHPAEGGSYDAEEYEFLELKNQGTRPLSLAGFQFTAGIGFVFDPTNSPPVLAPGEYLVLVRNRAAFQARYPGITNLAGPYTGALANEGERIRLEGPLGEAVWEFTYSDAWHRTSDGAGFSLVPRAEGTVISSAAAWRPSASPGGSPGRPDPDPPDIPPVRIHEVLTHTDPPLVDAIELYNPTAATVDVGGWFLTDDRSVPRKYVFPPRSLLPPFGFLVVDASQFGAGASGFELSSLGDEVWLFSGDGTHLTGHAHGFRFGAAANGISFGRHLDSLGREHFVAQAANSLGAPNAGPRVGPVVIHEIMFEPPPSLGYADTLHEYVELRNLTDQPIPLYDPVYPTNTWRLEGVGYVFPTGVVLAPQGYLLVVSFDPQRDPGARAMFRQRYNLADSVMLVGPMPGKLANEGERLQLLRPDPPQTLPNPFIGYVPYVLVDEVEYLPGPPWPSGAAGTGLSLQRRVGHAFGNDPAHWETAPPTPGAPNYSAAQNDADEDGLPDAWETAHGLDPGRAVGEDGAAGDPDGDGMTNAQEYVAGTHPRDSTSLLRLEGLGRSGDFILLEFEAQPGRVYELWGADRIEGPWQVLRVLGPQPDRQTLRIEDEAGEASQRYYRLRVRFGP
ncbi:lamin tail domain-containing protein [Limisphaera sp. VF-2]|uniref:lamin tail domain-containing protein n=1 Tax=Limisphaera sp. VF-2 TaxID=3400418 RepID=UPI001765EB40